jgi:hypothetical protein
MRSKTRQISSREWTTIIGDSGADTRLPEHGKSSTSVDRILCDTMRRTVCSTWYCYPGHQKMFRMMVAAVEQRQTLHFHATLSTRPHLAWTI